MRPPEPSASVYLVSLDTVDSGPGPLSRLSEIREHSGEVVGLIRTSADPGLGSTVGRIEELEISHPDPDSQWRSGAVLEAEKRFRAMGCKHSQVTLRPDDQLVPLFSGLGYVELSHTMHKPLGSLPGIAPGSSARPMDEDDFLDWSRQFRTDYVRALRQSGMSAGAAETHAEHWVDELSSTGISSPRYLFRVLVHDDLTVGYLWGGRDGNLSSQWFVYDIRIHPDYRGGGHGRTLMHVAEVEALASGCSVVALSVFAGNQTARRLYISLGYTVSNSRMLKDLEA
ncbi:GNAT family N-acetyltransferase [Streptomyces sp. NPDC053720]|uniref:GNAT family N-acetyltransferase n=1 Tax=Streptomyces sp. NPDC053720 TaxID=3154855 RepID=UPI003421AD66